MSDERTAEQIKAQDDLQIAIENHVIAFRTGLSDNLEVTGDWLMVASVQSIDLDHQERRYAYHLAFSGGEQPEHIAYGLLHTADQIIAEGEAR